MCTCNEEVQPDSRVGAFADSNCFDSWALTKEVQLDSRVGVLANYNYFNGLGLTNRKQEGFSPFRRRKAALTINNPDEFEREIMNRTTNSSSCPSALNPTAATIGKTFAYCLILVASLVGNSLIRITVYKTQTLRKPIKYFIANMAVSDLLYPIFVFPWELTKLYVNSWLISGPLGQTLCKLLYFLPGVASLVSIQSLVLIAVDRFGAGVFPLRSPLISSKLCSFFILSTWILAMAVFSPYLFAMKLVVEYADGKLSCVI